VVPFIWNCIEFGNTNDTYDSQYWWSDKTIVVNSLNAFPILTWGLTRIWLVILLVSSLLLVISGWVLIASSWREWWNYWAWKDMIRKVVMWIAAIWASWVILNLINPSFFS
jgi:hypothetical protein